ncbi:MAG: hypothetical protein ACYC3I_01255 [Gemmataceae bacterium]
MLFAGVASAQQPQPPATVYTPWSSAPDALAAVQPPRQPPPVGENFPLERGQRPPEDWEQPAPYTIQLEAPSIYRVAISVESDAQLQERIRQENRERKTPERIVFPYDPVISTDEYQGRKWDPAKMEVAPYYVCHGRLPFQQINFERYGWDLGVFTPLISSSLFLFDFVMWPYNICKEPLRRVEYNTGWCLPGDPVPLLLYPIQVSLTGFFTEVATILTLVVVFP